MLGTIFFRGEGGGGEKMRKQRFGAVTAMTRPCVVISRNRDNRSKLGGGGMNFSTLFCKVVFLFKQEVFLNFIFYMKVIVLFPSW